MDAEPRRRCRCPRLCIGCAADRRASERADYNRVASLVAAVSRHSLNPSLQVRDALTSKSALESGANPDRTRVYTDARGNSDQNARLCSAVTALCGRLLQKTRNADG